MKAIVTIFNERLLRLANYLGMMQKHSNQGKYGMVHLAALEGRVRIHYTMKYPIWAFETITRIESINQEEGLIPGIIDYYNLTLDEFGHLFDLEGYQLIERFGGTKLTLDSSSLEISRNIREFVRRREG